MLSNQIIVIHGDKIASIAPADQVQIPAGANVIDLTQSTVLPGLIDCHTHIMLADTDDSHYDEILLKQSWQYRTILATLNVKKDLEAGFTAMRDVETEGAMYSDVDVRNAINEGLIPGPRLKVATRGISTTGGYGLEGYSPEVTVPIGVQTIDGPYEARKAVREQFNYGADLIKIYGTHRYSFTLDGKIKSIADFSLEETDAIVDEARLKGIKVACHAYDGPGLHYCIDSGVASIEHGIQLDESHRQNGEKGNLSRPHSVCVFGSPRKSRFRYVRRKNQSPRDSRSEFQESASRRREDCLRHRCRPIPPRHASNRIRMDDALRHAPTRRHSLSHNQRRRPDGLVRPNRLHRARQIRRHHRRKRRPAIGHQAVGTSEVRNERRPSNPQRLRSKVNAYSGTTETRGEFQPAFRLL
jgi:hypothetical protein